MRVPLIYLLSAVTSLRLLGLIVGCLYGPYIYLVLPLGALYLSFDVLTLYFVIRSEEEAPENSNTRGIKITWIILNVFAFVGLFVAIVLFLDQVGFWSMSHEAILLVQFFVVVFLSLAIVATMGVLAKSLRDSRRGYPIRYEKRPDWRGP